MRSPPLSLLRLAPLLLAPICVTAGQAMTFKHIVIIVQENRTPDNLFGSNPTFEPGVDIGTSGVNSKGQTIPLMPVALTACYDIDHRHGSFEVAFHSGFDKEIVGTYQGCTPPPNPQFKYVDNSSGAVQPYFDIATSYGFSNRMFETNQGPSFLAHQFLFGGTSAPSTNSSLFASENPLSGDQDTGCTAPTKQTVEVVDSYGSEHSHSPIYPCFEHPTLTDVLEAAKPAVSWRYYAPMPGSIWTAPDAIRHICQPMLVNNVMTCTGPDWTNGNVVANNSAQVLTDIKSCNLQAVSWVIPTGEESDHAKINNGTGPQWVASVVNAIGHQKTCPHSDTYWNDTAILITWDDWGGWFDHVKPFQINVRPITPKAPAVWGDGYTYGFRVPLLVVSAYTPAGYVDNRIHDFGSILYFVEQNFGLGFIGPGNTVFSKYADFQARSRGDLSMFFTLATPRTFTPIASKMTAQDFIAAPRSTTPPDDD